MIFVLNAYISTFFHSMHSSALECKHTHSFFLFAHQLSFDGSTCIFFFNYSPCLSFCATSFVRSNWLNFRKSSSKTHLCRGQSVGLSSSLSAIFLIVLGKRKKSYRRVPIDLPWPTVVGTQFCYQFRLHANEKKKERKKRVSNLIFRSVLNVTWFDTSCNLYFTSILSWASECVPRPNLHE